MYKIYYVLVHFTCTEGRKACLATTNTIYLKANNSVDFDASTLSAMSLKLQKILKR